MRHHRLMAVGLLTLGLFLGWSGRAIAQYSPDTLNQMVAPIALYPDPLVAQLLMAAAYPQEVIEAAAWVKQNPNMSESARTQALASKTWDPSVSSLTAFPDVLSRMASNTDWMQALGEAFLAQQADVLKAVQNMRAMAQRAGTLESTPQQTVTTTDQVYVAIQPTDDSNYCIPYYDSSAVYGSSWSSTDWMYPGVMGAWGGYAAGRSMYWGTRVAVGNSMYGSVNWSGRGVYCNPTVNNYPGYRGAGRYNNAAAAGVPTAWQYNQQHRQGVNYTNPQLRKTYGTTNSGMVNNSNLRGYGATNTRTTTTPTAQRNTRTPAATTNKYWNGPTTSTPQISNSAFNSMVTQQRQESLSSQRGASSMGGSNGMYGRYNGGASRSVNTGGGGYGGNRGGGGRGGRR